MAHSSQESAGSISVSSAPGCESCGNASQTITAAAYLRSIGRTFPASQTCATCLAPRGRRRSTSSLVARHAKDSVTPASDLDSSIRARVFGQSSPGWLASFDRELSSWRTSQLCLDGGLAEFLGDLAALGYDAEWTCIRAAEVGAPHHRARLWLVAYPNGQRVERFFSGPLPRFPEFSWVEGVGRLADLRGRSDLPEPLISRKDDGLSRGMDAIGNALLPQIAEWIGRRIMSYEFPVPVAGSER